MNITCLNFDVQIQHAVGEGGYRLLVESPTGETVRLPFEMPFSEMELENFVLKAGPARRGVRRADTQEVEAARRFGEKLYSALFTGDVRSAMQSSLDQARQRADTSRTRLGVRIRLRLTDVPEMTNVPWEYLYNPSLSRFLALSTETPLVRYIDLPERPRPLKVTAPLRILVIIAGPRDYPPLDVRQEWNNLDAALSDLQHDGLVELELLQTPTLSGLQRQLRRGDYHIFHFIGHGAFDTHAEDGLLAFEDDENRGRLVSGQDLAMLLHDHPSLRLAVLNACEGARSTESDPFAGVAQSLVLGGLPAVIAMQFEITDRAAIAFAHEFYRAVSDGYPVDAALTEARKVIFTEARGNGLEWGTPVLYMRSPDGQIFNVQRRRLNEHTRSASAAIAVERSESTVPLVAGDDVAAIVEEPVESLPPISMGGAARVSPPGSEPTFGSGPAPQREPIEDTPFLQHSSPPSPATETPQAAGATTIAAPATQMQISPPRKNRWALLVVGAALVALLLSGVASWWILGGGTSAPPSEQRESQAQAHIDNGLDALDNKDFDKALAEFDQAIKIKPDSADAYFNRATAYNATGEKSKAIEDYTQAIKLSPNSAKLYIDRANAYEERGDYDKAIEDFSIAITLSPTTPDSYFNRGLLYMDNGEFDQAIDDFNKVADLSPGDDDAYYRRGLAYAAKADYETAIQDYSKALNINPEAYSVYLDRGLAYQSLGDYASAIGDYRTALAQAQEKTRATMP